MELQSLLFKAYNAAATPREIDPFIVRLHSPRHRIIRELSGNLDRMGKWVGAAREGPNAETILRNLSIVSIVQEIADLNVPVGQIYKFHLPGKDSIDWASRWKAITKRVDKLAA
jgi:hypothetical protein